MEKIDLNKLEAKDGVVTIVHQTAKEARVYEEKSVNINGSITAPGNFIEVRKEQDKFDRSHVIFSYNGLFIKLITQEQIEGKGTEVLGNLKQNPEIAKLKINTQEKLTVKSLSDLLRFNKFFFADKDENLTIVSNLQKFKLSAQTEIETANDNKGNAKDLYEIKSASNMVLEFTLFMPIYIGQPAKKFKVEVAYAVRERNIEVWLESPELAELLQSNAVEIIGKELERFPEEIVRIEQ